jgi:sarcosine/dimethylglycine N-methyltransferase
MTKHEEIKTMKLYHHLDRIERRLQLANKTSSSNSPELPTPDSTNKSPLDPELLGTLDTLHFFGDEPIQKIQQLITLQRQIAQDTVHVLDIGTGYGGSARLLAHRTGCHVDALELQPDLSAVAQQLTARCALDNRVTHLTGDFLLRQVATERYNVIVGLLCFLHIGQWQELFARCLQSLAPGGVLYVEDFFQRGDTFSQREKEILKDDVYCAELGTKQQLQAALEAAGFTDVQFEDVTEKWTPYVTVRAETFRADLATHIEADGEDTARALDHFYTSVADVFAMGNLGGYTLKARRPLA